MNNREHFGVLVLAGVVSLGAVGVAYATLQYEKKAAPEIVVEATPELARGSSQKDSDGDGLPDWKELFIGTDPHNADTDNDGVSDADEIAQGVNPLRAGAEPLETNSSYVAPNGLSSIDALGRELFATYATLKQEDGFSPTTINDALDDIIARRLSNDNTGAGTYTLADLSFAQDDSTSARLAYRAGVTKALSRADVVAEYEINTVYTLLETSDLKHAKTLRDNAELYYSIVDDLRRVPVPDAWAQEHLEMVNALQSGAHAVMAMGNGYGDPYDMLLAVNMFVESEARFSDAYRAFSSLVATTP